MGKEIRRVAVVLNSSAGALLGFATAEEDLRRAFAHAGLEAWFIPASAGSLSQRMAIAVKSNPDAVAVGGGDGTIACAASALVSRGIPLAILPCGTMNLLARDLSIPTDDLEAAIAIIGNGSLLDVGEVNGHFFLCASMLGVPAWLGRTREDSRGAAWRAWVRMARAIWKQMLRTQRLRVTLVADGRPMPARAAALTITVNPFTRSAGRAFGRAQLGSGQFGIYILDTFGIGVLLALAGRILFGRRNARVREHVASEIDIVGRSRAMRVMNDGELFLLVPPLHYRIWRGALRVVAP